MTSTCLSGWRAARSDNAECDSAEPLAEPADDAPNELLAAPMTSTVAIERAAAKVARVAHLIRVETRLGKVLTTISCRYGPAAEPSPPPGRPLALRPRLATGLPFSA